MKKFLLGLALVVAMGATAHADSKYRVTITNMTANQSFTPILIATHRPGIKIFDNGGPASDAIERMAEGGDTSFLQAELEGQGVSQFASTGGLLGPGETASVEINVYGTANHLSLAGMLLPTNDGFVALNDVAGPSGDRTVKLYALAYDAGSEENTESCADIPPAVDPCVGQGGTGFDSSRVNAEGFVHVHRGIHGVDGGDLAADEFDWRNPVAIVYISRVNGR